MKSLFNVGKPGKLKNPYKFEFKDYTAENIAAAMDPVLLNDTGLSEVIANDTILIRALENPQTFITARKTFIEGIASQVSVFLLSTSGVLNTFVDIGDTAKEQLFRNIGAQILSTFVNEVDKRISGVNDLAVQKLSNT